jgi:predicted restriction endonuclease
MPTTDIPATDDRAIAVRSRDEQCAICDQSPAEATLQIHEIVPGDDDAENRMANYILLCKEHHKKAHHYE